MDYIKNRISEVIESFNVHNDSSIGANEILDPFVRDHSNYDSFDNLAKSANLNEDYKGIDPEKFDSFIFNNIDHVKVSDLHSLITQAMNKYHDI